MGFQINMRVTVKATLAAIATTAAAIVGFLAFRSGALIETAVPIPDRAFVGFENCRASQELLAIMEDLFARGKPIAKESDRWVYAVDGRFMGVRISRLELGVCNSTGERGCGWAIYTGLGMDLSKEATRQVLKDKTGIDFTEELRDNEANATMRPVLSVRPNIAGSLLFCDAGDL
jgi:hypothetical protein